MKIEITAVKRDETEILLNLIEKFEYKLSQYFDHHVNESGLYVFGTLESIE